MVCQPQMRLSHGATATLRTWERGNNPWAVECLSLEDVVLTLGVVPDGVPNGWQDYGVFH